MARTTLVVALASCVACSNAFLAPAGFRRAATIRMAEEERSIALPYEKKPASLDGTLPGDVGFDPVGFSASPPKTWLYGGPDNSLKWYREAEIVHGRVAMLAALGWIVPEFVHFPGNEAVGVDAFANKNPLAALYQVPESGLWQIAVTTAAIEFYRIQRIVRGDKEPGDLGLGQGPDRWNPFGFKYSEEEYFEKQVQEIKNGRLAMIAILGLFFQAQVTGQGVISQLAGAFSTPEAVTKAGYYFPTGI